MMSGSTSKKKGSNGGIAALSAKAGQAAASQFLGNVLQKLVTFVFNAMLVRKTNPQIFGVAAVQLELLLSTLLFLSREGVRLAVVKEGHRGQVGASACASASSASESNKRDHQKLVNLSWLPALLLVAGSAAIVGQLNSGAMQALLPSGGGGGDSLSGVSTLVVLLYCAGALLECAAEPWLNLYAINLAVGAKARAEGVAVAVRSLATYTCVAHLDMGVLGFGVAQVLHGAALLLVAVAQQEAHLGVGVPVGLRGMLPAFVSRPISTPRDATTDTDTVGGLVGRRMLHTAGAATASSALKHLLTEADKIVLALTRDPYDQGIYAVCSNYGGLVARMLLQPLEESCRLTFARLAAHSSSGTGDSAENKSEGEAEAVRGSGRSASVPRPRSRSRSKGRNLAASSGRKSSKGKGKKAALTDVATTSAAATVAAAAPVSPEALAVMVQMLRRSLLLVAFVGVTIAALGPAYVRVFMSKLMAPQWRGEETVQTLRAFCWYIMILGVNGVSEAFMYAVAPSAHFLYINGAMVLSTTSYAACLLYTPLLSALTGYSDSGEDEEGGSMLLTGAARIVYANACGMAVRVVCAAGYDWWYLRKHMYGAAGTGTVKSPPPLLQWVLRLAAFLTAELAAALTTRHSEALLLAAPENEGSGGVAFSWPLARHLLCGVLSGLGVVATALVVLPEEDSAALLRTARVKLPARLALPLALTAAPTDKAKRE